MERARKHGVAVVGLKNSHHIGRVGHWAEQCARAGLVSTHWVNVHGHKSLVAPFGGAEPRFTKGPGGGDGDQARPQDGDGERRGLAGRANADVDKHNPIGKIPALSVKGMDLFDSPVICEYLDSQHKGRKLLPRKGLQAMADGLLDAAILTRYEGALGPRTSAGPTGSRARPRRSRACSPNSRPRPNR